MMDLADKIIARHKQEEKRKVDEYGIPLPNKEDERKLCNYLCARAIVRNKNLHSRNLGGRIILYNAHTPVPCMSGEVAYLCGWLKHLNFPMTRYIYDKLLDIMPRLDPNKIAITPYLIWDIEKQELIESDHPVKTVSSFTRK